MANTYIALSTSDITNKETNFYVDNATTSTGVSDENLLRIFALYNIDSVTSSQTWSISESIDIRLEPVETRHKLSLQNLGWDIQQAQKIRALFAPVAEDWDDPEMDIYNDL